MKRLKVGDEDKNSRADKFVSAKYPKFARAAVSKLFSFGAVRRRGEQLKAGEKLKPGDELVIEDSLLVNKPPDIDIPIIYEDDDCVVINKPVGILSHS
jgi:23S rRNA-/tRNA-specific pseudouridylate synthase